MIICTPRPEADARQLQPPDAYTNIARFWAGALDTTVLLPFNLWFAFVFKTNVTAIRDEAV